MNTACRTVQPRSKALDILRAVAILLVFCRHMTVCPETTNKFLFHVSRVLECGGWIGVDLFFVLSGFLISGLLFREYQKKGRISPGQFLIRRGFKIYPAFFVFLSVSVVLTYISTRTIHWKGILVESLFLTSYLRQPAMFNHTWSLGVEEHFYLLLPALFVLLIRRTRGSQSFSSIPRICLWLATACLAARVINVLVWPDHHSRPVFQSHCRFDSLFFGVLLSYYSHFKTEAFNQLCAKRWVWFLIAGIMCYAPAFYFPLFETPIIYTFGFTLFTFGGGCLLMGFLGMPIANSSLIARCLALIGMYSYSIYLWHGYANGYMYAFIVGKNIHLWNWIAYFICYVGASILYGMLLAKVVEFPCLAIRDRLYPSRS
jgi:peptidoglycan/LPS O-acetylase OafA/YrhL